MIKMKSIQYKLLLFCTISIFLFSACDDSFLEIRPDNYIPESDLLNTPEDAQEYLNSSYKALAGGDFMGGNFQILSELSADNINGSLGVLNNGDWLTHYTWTTDIFLGTTRTLMQGGGRTQGRANYLMERLDNVEGLSAEDSRRMLAEGRFLRAVAHFELVRMFAQPYGFTSDNSHLGIPIYLSQTIEPVNQSTVGEVYAQIVSDLTAAAADLPDTNNGYATSWAAKGYLAKVYFQMNNFQEAHDMADDVIRNSGFGFDTDLTLRFSQEGTSEGVFELISTSENNNSGGAIADHYRVSANGTAGVYYSDDFFSQVANPNDLRGTTWVEKLSSELVVCHKFETDRTKWFNVPLVHITGLKLIRAESAAELGVNLDVARQDINDIKVRAGLEELSPSASDFSIITQARKERRIELIGEGNRLHDLKRIGAASRQGLTKLESNNLKIRNIAPWDCDGMVCQYPDAELKGNPDLVPNPSGGCN